MILNLLMMLACCVAPPPEAGERAYPFKEQYDLFKHGGDRAKARLALLTPRVPIGERIDFEVLLVCEGRLHYLNPFLVPLKQPMLPAALVIYDRDKNYIGNLWFWEGGSSVRGNGPWISVPAGGLIGRKSSVMAGWVPGTRHSAVNRPLPPGTYYLQVIYLNAFIGWSNVTNSYSLREAATADEFERLFDRGELFRSNVVELELLPKQEK